MPVYKGLNAPSQSNSSGQTNKLRRLAAALNESAQAALSLSHNLDMWRKGHPGQPDDPALVKTINTQNRKTLDIENQIVQAISEAQDADPSAVRGALDLNAELGRLVTPGEYAQRVNRNRAGLATPLPPKYDVSPRGVVRIDNASETRERLQRAAMIARIEGTVAPTATGLAVAATEGAKALLHADLHPVESAETGLRADAMFLRGTAQFTGAEVVGEETVRWITAADAAAAGAVGRHLPGAAGRTARYIASKDRAVSNKMRDLAEGYVDANGDFVPGSVNGFVGFLPWTAGDMVNSFGGGVIPAAERGGADAAFDAVIHEDPAQFANDAMIVDGFIRGGMHIGEVATRGIARLRQSGPLPDSSRSAPENAAEPTDAPAQRQVRRFVKARNSGTQGRTRRTDTGSGKPASTRRLPSPDRAKPESTSEPGRNDAVEPARIVESPETRRLAVAQAGPANSRVYVRPDDVRGPNGETLELPALFVDGITHDPVTLPSGNEYSFESGIQADMDPEKAGRFAIRARTLTKAKVLGKRMAAGPGKAVLVVLNPIAMLGNPDAVSAALSEAQRAIEAGVADPKHVSDLITLAARLARIQLPDTGKTLASPLDIDPYSITPKRLTRFQFYFGGDPQDDDVANQRTSNGLMSNRVFIGLINDYKGTRRGAAVHVVQYDPGATAPVYLGDIDKNGRPVAFPWAISGFGLGDIVRPIPFEAGFTDFIQSRGNSQFRHTFWSAQLSNPDVPFTDELINQYIRIVQGGETNDARGGESNDSAATKDLGRHEKNGAEIARDRTGGRRVYPTGGAEFEHSEGSTSHGPLGTKSGGTAGSTKGRAASQTSTTEAVETKSAIVSSPAFATVAAFVRRLDDALKQSGLNLFDIYRGAPSQVPPPTIDKNRHTIPPSPSPPAGPARSASVTAGLRAMRTAYLG